MKTFTEAKPMVVDHDYQMRRARSSRELEAAFESGSIDAPISELVKRISRIPYCFTLQSCYGHFVFRDGTEEHSMKRISQDMGEGTTVRYRVAYMAFCLQDGQSGVELLDDLKAVHDVDPDYIQFGSADWFWNICVNTYVLQAEPERWRSEDYIDIDASEALRIETARDLLYSELEAVIDTHIDSIESR